MPYKAGLDFMEDILISQSSQSSQEDIWSSKVLSVVYKIVID